VYSATYSSIVYQGSNATLAQNSALAQSTVGIRKSILEEAKVFATNGVLTIKDLPTGIMEVKLFTAHGQLI